MERAISSLLEVVIQLVLIGFLCEYIAATLGMGYGTCLAPILIILGYEPLVLVPVILISQLFAALIASAFHYRFKNMNIFDEQKERMTIVIFITTGVVGVLVAILVNASLPAIIVKAYISFVIIGMGILMLRKRQQEATYSQRALVSIGIFAAFNKGMSGAGYGPITNSGQILSGINPKAAIAITALVQGIICIVGVVLYYTLVGTPDQILSFGISIGAILAAPFSALTTSKLDQAVVKKIVAISTIAIGCFTLLWIIFL